MVSNLYGAIDYAIKTKRFIGGLGRLKKDGSIGRINGQIYSRKTTKGGAEVVLIDNFLGRKRRGTKKRWTLVLADNLLAFNENKWQHVKKTK